MIWLLFFPRVLCKASKLIQLLCFNKNIIYKGGGAVCHVKNLDHYDVIKLYIRVCINQGKVLVFEISGLPTQEYFRFGHSQNTCVILGYVFYCKS